MLPTKRLTERWLFSSVGALAVALAISPPALAQIVPATPEDAAAAGAETSSEIVVTARRREETLMSVPAAVSVVGDAEIESRGIVRLDSLAQSVPQLLLGAAGSGAQGGVIVIRGIGVGEANPFADQAVSLNIDGVQIGQANARRISEIDMVQVDVLKGPQALYFGKNSPAGIIAIRTADPTRQISAGIKSGYEFVADEVRGEAFLAGPISNNAGTRLAFFFSTMNGYFKNATSPDPIYGSVRSKVPHEREFGGRLTLQIESGSTFEAKLKAAYGNLHTTGPQADAQTVNCPFGYAQTAPQNEDCKANDTIHFARPGPNFLVLAPELVANPYLDMEQTLIGLEINYQPSETITISSTTGFYDLNQQLAGPFAVFQADRIGNITNSYWNYNVTTFSQELRMQSSFNGPLNFMLGAYYQHSKLFVLNDVVAFANAPRALVTTIPATQRGDALSGFAQVTFNITATLELAAGGRYSYEHKAIAYTTRAGAPLVTAVPEKSWENFSPEATLTWRPSRDLTIYGAYKTGFLSGGFSGSNGNAAADRSYDQQTVRGFEIGIKALNFDRRLRTALTLYTYDTLGLQINANVQVAGNPAPLQVVLNAGKSRTRGIELEANFEVSNALRLHGSVGYNDARYIRFVGPCWAGQTIAMGCNQVPNASGVFTSQDLSGARMLRAPEWTLQGGFGYSHPVGDDQKLELTADVAYSSGFFTSASNKPGGYQPGFAMVDVGLTYKDERRGFTIGLLGKNLTNQFVFYRSIDSVFTGSGTGTASGVPSDTLAPVNRGREIRLRASVEWGGAR